MKRKRTSNRLKESIALLEQAMVNLAQVQALFLARIDQFNAKMDRFNPKADQIREFDPYLARIHWRFDRLEALLLQLPERIYDYGKATGQLELLWPSTVPRNAR